MIIFVIMVKRQATSEKLKGNKNAEIWTFEKACELYDRAIDLTNETEIYIKGSGQYTTQYEGYKFDFIGEIATELNVYRDLLAEHLPSRFPELKVRFLQLKQRLESNCYSNSKKEYINTAVGIVNLKSNHGWRDRMDNTTDDKPINTPQLNEQQTADIIAALKPTDNS